MVAPTAEQYPMSGLSNLPPGVTERMIPGNDAPPEELLWDALLIAADIAEQIRDDEEAFAIMEKIGEAAALINGGPDLHCDGCSIAVDREVFLQGGRFHWAVMTDGNGEPDVSICPRCQWNYDADAPS